MKIKDQTAWAEFRAINDDSPYGLCIIKFAVDRADAIEAHLIAGETVAQCADSCSRVIDKKPGYGITGNMYAMAVQTLVGHWEHGEELRLWHNEQM